MKPEKAAVVRLGLFRWEWRLYYRHGTVSLGGFRFRWTAERDMHDHVARYCL